ncbi:MAG: PIN domain-containing protein [Nocardioides sp.]|uniref:type II toxin-antitoxin system VapC family toxin n=1 Tax=Nocardioides sp. TaxID=35761 RepID=UPI0039E2885F
MAAAVKKQPHNHPCVEMFTGLRLAGRRLLVPPTVVAEVGFMLDKLGGSRAEKAFLLALGRRDFDPVDLTTDDYTRMAELVEQYDDLRLGTTDASVIALAERLNITDVATLDRRHFTAVRPQHVEALTLLPERL